jgi:hypothetical protein
MQNKDNIESFEAMTLWKSDGKSLNGESFLTVKEANSYYCYSSRAGQDSVAFILYNDNDKSFGLIEEIKPPLNERENKIVRLCTAFGGSCDTNNTYEEIVKNEVLEESGYEVPLDRIHHVSKTFVSTQMDQYCELFLVDVTDIDKTQKAEHEITFNELSEEQKKNSELYIGNSVKWMNANELMDNNDWKSITIFTKAVYLNIICK